MYHVATRKWRGKVLWNSWTGLTFVGLVITTKCQMCHQKDGSIMCSSKCTCNCCQDWTQHYHGSLLRPWPQKMAVFRGQGWHLDPHSPVLIKISADKRPLNQLTVKNLFFSLNEENLYTIGEVTLFSPEWKELTSMLDPLLYRWSVPPVVIRCVHRTMQMWVLQTWIKVQGIAIVMNMSMPRRLSVFTPLLSPDLNLTP